MLRRFMGRWTAAFAGGSLKKIAAAAALGLAAFGTADQAAAATTFTGQFGDGGTWNVYELINNPFTWEEAWKLAPTRSNPITGNAAVGHLVTLTDLAENNFVHSTAGGGDLWIGLTDRVGISTAMESFNEFDPRNGGWAWVTGEPYTFADPDFPGILGYWGNLEPNDAGRPASGEDAAHIRGDGRWNDHQSGFDLDEPVAHADNTPEGQQTFRFVIEWDTELASQPAGFPMTRPDPTPPPLPPIPRVFPTPLARLPGPDGTASAWGGMDVLHGAGVGTINETITRVVAGEGTRVEGTYSIFAFRDPNTNGTTPVAGGTAVPYISDTGADDNNFDTVVKGTIVVPAGQGGDYTFQVRSDDGFAMRILSQASPGDPVVQHPFANSTVGRIDEDGALTFPTPTGDSNTRGLINLAPGTYDVEFIMYENGGGAFGEVSTAKGNWLFPAPGTAPQWLLLGDGRSLPEEGPFNQPARLSGNVTVKNFDRGAITNVAEIVAQVRDPASVPTAEATFDDAILFDGDDICCGRPGAGLDPSFLNEFPNGGNDQFTTSMTGQLQVLDTNGAAGETLTFGLFADDNAALHLIGQNFTVAGGGGTLGNPEGMADQWLIADFRTGNTNAYGAITLAEGTYNFETFQLEEGGDAGLEVWVAAGDLTAGGFDAARFFPLTAATLTSDIVLSANQGLGLVMGPGTGPSGGALDGDFDGDGDVDAADYVVWRKTDNTPAGYTLWRTNFGRTAGSGSALSAVPEPASALLLAVCLMMGGALVSRRRAN